MSEKDWWATCQDPKEMLAYVYGPGPIPSKRKGRLLAVGLCRMIAHLFWEDEFPTILTDVENVADGKQRASILYHTWTYYRAFLNYYPQDELAIPRYCLVHAVHYAAESPNTYRLNQILDNVKSAVVQEQLQIPRELPFEEYFQRANNNEVIPVVRTQQADLIREILGNPFVQKKITPSNDMIRMAELAYDGHTEYLGVLGDLLEDSEYASLTTHLRARKHPKGCWVIDLILGKH